jgi:hypothetical protein
VESLQNLLGQIKGVLISRSQAGVQITVWTIICFIVLLFVLFYLRQAEEVLVARVLARSRLDVERSGDWSITRYVVLLVGLLIIIQTVGINLTTLNVVAGAVGIGIGLDCKTLRAISSAVLSFSLRGRSRLEIGSRLEELRAR